MKPEARLVFSESPLNDSLLPGPVAWGWIVAAGAAVLLVGALLLAQRFRRRNPPQAPGKRVAYGEALECLEAAARLPAREAATEASFAIRRYLCAMLEDPSLFETHEEFLDRHPSISRIDHTTLTTLTETLKQLAEIKYRKPEEPADASPLLHQSRELLLALDDSSAA